MIKLPSNYTEHTVWHPSNPESQGTFGYHFGSENRIEYYPRWWYALVWPIMKYFIMKHERVHAWGIRKCLSGSKTCVMYEDNDTYWGKLKLLPIQIWGFGRFCKECRKYLHKHSAL